MMAGQSTKVGPVPARSGSALYPGFSNTVPPGFGRIQRLEKGSQRTQRGGLRPTSGTYARMPSSLLYTKGNLQQVINMSNSSMRKIGGVPPTANTAGFAYTSTSTSLTWYWDGTNGSQVPVITRADLSKFTVPTSGSGLTVSGLSPTTTYYFLPFWNTQNTCNIGWVQGTVGSPQIAFVVGDTTDPVNGPVYLIEQTQQGNEPLTAGFMTAVTTTSGSGGGGVGGGGGFCVMAGTDIVTVGDFPYELKVMPETEWVHLKIEDGRELYCTYDHPLYHAVSGKIKASMLSEGDPVITDIGEQKIVTANFSRRVCSKHCVHISRGHLFWANGFLSHNMKVWHP